MYAPAAKKSSFGIEYDLLASLIRIAIDSNSFSTSITEEESDKVHHEVMSFISKYESQLRGLTLSTESYNDIMVAFERMDPPHRCNTISELDRCIPYVDHFSHDKFTVFDALNANWDAIGLRLLPFLDSPVSIRSFDGKEHTRKDENEISWEGSGIMHNYYFVLTQDLDGFNVDSIYLNVDAGAVTGDMLTIGVAPLIGKRDHPSLKHETIFEPSEDGKYQQSLYDNFELSDPEDINMRVKEAIIHAAKLGVNILLMPEMMGTAEQYSIDDYGYNSFLYSIYTELDVVDHLFFVCMPTRWINNSNILGLYLPNGKRIALQYKQHRFYKGSGISKIYENLKRIPKSIVLLHIPRWGRFVFPICIDYLEETYRRILAKYLRASFVLCPSYSPGTSNFDLALQAISEYAATVVWINCCEATSSDEAGILMAPTVPIERGRRYFIKKDCNGRCDKGCLFTISIPKNLADNDSPNLDKEVPLNRKIFDKE